ncbi:acyl-[acyl-carrier-protein]--UDP-N-acetylglucosamine O-acyltransferase [Ranunculus cassubicifolius]
MQDFARIGSFAFRGGGSVIALDVPKYMMVSGDRAQLRGLNLEGLRHNGFSSEQVENGVSRDLQEIVPVLTRDLN